LNSRGNLCKISLGLWVFSHQAKGPCSWIVGLTSTNYSAPTSQVIVVNEYEGPVSFCDGNVEQFHMV